VSVFRITAPGRYGRPGVVIVRFAKRKPDGNQRPVATGFTCDVELVPELIGELKSPVEIAKDEGLTIPGVRDRLQSGRRS
jgi:hypothetical protein